MLRNIIKQIISKACFMRPTTIDAIVLDVMSAVYEMMTKWRQTLLLIMLPCTRLYILPISSSSREEYVPSYKNGDIIVKPVFWVLAGSNEYTLNFLWASSASRGKGTSGQVCNMVWTEGWYNT